MSSSRRKKDSDNDQQEEQQQSESQSQSQSGQSRGRGGRSQRAQTQQSEQGQQRQEEQARQANGREEPRELEPTEVFDPLSATRLATLRLARSWRYGGKTYAAMHAYERILDKYGGTPAANAAAEELIAMAGELEREGKFYTALNIFNKIEEYYDPARQRGARAR